MEYLVYPANRRGTCIKGFCPTTCEGYGNAMSEAYRLHRSLSLQHIKYYQVIINEKK